MFSRLSHLLRLGRPILRLDVLEMYTNVSKRQTKLAWSPPGLEDDLLQYQLDELLALLEFPGVAAEPGPLARLPDVFDDVADQFVRDDVGFGGPAVEEHTPFDSRDDRRRRSRA